MRLVPTFVIEVLAPCILAVGWAAPAVTGRTAATSAKHATKIATRDQIERPDGVVREPNLCFLLQGPGHS